MLWRLLKLPGVIVDEDNHSMEVVVPDDQLSLAIENGGRTFDWRQN